MLNHLHRIVNDSLCHQIDNMMRDHHVGAAREITSCIPISDVKDLVVLRFG
jgi:hypothetical protein